jgi:hypothetical protein
MLPLSDKMLKSKPLGATSYSSLAHNADSAEPLKAITKIKQFWAYYA